jgi:hypothetical protein
MLIYMVTVVGLTAVGSSTVHIYTKNITQTNIMVQNTQNITYITIRIHKDNIKNT